jgi:hypothetical protein
MVVKNRERRFVPAVCLAGERGPGTYATGPNTVTSIDKHWPISFLDIKHWQISYLTRVNFNKLGLLGLA